MTYHVEKRLKLTRPGQRRTSRVPGRPPATLVFSTGAPTEPGCYWHKHNGAEKVREVVARCDGVLYTWIESIGEW
jgi:hypothetical protein